MKTETKIKALAKSYVRSRSYGNSKEHLSQMGEQIQELLDRFEHEEPEKFDRLVLDLDSIGYWSD